MSLIRSPFFEFGPKAFLYGPELLALAQTADRLAGEYGVDIIFTVMEADIYPLAQSCGGVRVFAQHMDAITPGRGIGMALPEALRAAGAQGSLLNHAERRLDLHAIEHGILRAREAGLMTLVCADSPAQAMAIAHFGPDLILAESPALIGGGKRSEDDALAVTQTNRAVASINPAVQVMHSAGISNARDVFDIIAAGADGTGSTSAIVKAPDPHQMLESMIRAVRQAFDQRSDHNPQTL